MNLPSHKLPETQRQAVRFAVVGTIGTGIQYALYWCFLMLFKSLWPDVSNTTSDMLTSTAYTLGFLLETIINYLLTACYTFSSRPTWKNLGGFAASRVSNYVVQMVVLQSLLFMSIEEKLAGILTMIIAGVINFFVVRFFFKRT